MVNLLPKPVIRQMRRMYYVRLSIVLFLLLSASFFAGAALLVPSYILAERSADAGERYVHALEETVGLRERTGVTNEIRALAERTKILAAYAEKPTSEPFFREITEDIPDGVFISGIAFAKGDETFNISIAGSAETRTALLMFVDRLRESGAFDGVNIPVSQLATDTNIPFSISASYHPQL